MTPTVTTDPGMTIWGGRNFPCQSKISHCARGAKFRINMVCEFVNRVREPASKIISCWIRVFSLRNSPDIMPLNTRRKHHIRRQTYKGLNDLAPTYICQKLVVPPSGHAMQTRSQGLGMLNIKKNRLETSKRKLFLQRTENMESIRSRYQKQSIVNNIMMMVPYHHVNDNSPPYNGFLSS